MTEFSEVRFSHSPKKMGKYPRLPLEFITNLSRDVTMQWCRRRKQEKIYPSMSEVRLSIIARKLNEYPAR
jgi:hypothetical protein